MKKRLYLLKTAFLSNAARLLISALSSTLRIYKINPDIPERLKKDGKKIVYVFWHGRQFLTVYAHRNLKISVMTSLSKDGDLQTAILSGFGYRCVRGSSSRGASRAVREMIHVMRDGYDSAFAVDGPRGPLYKVKPGALFLAKITGAIVLPVSCAAERARVFNKAWDKYVLPLPFSRAVIAYGEPIEIKRGDDLQAKAIETEKSLNKLTAKAEDFLNGKR